MAKTPKQMKTFLEVCKDLRNGNNFNYKCVNNRLTLLVMINSLSHSNN